MSPLQTMSQSKENNPQGNSSALWAFLLALLGLSFAAYQGYQGFLNDDSRPIMSWLLGFSVWLSVGIGMLFIVMIWHVFGAAWPIVIRRQLEHALAAFPYLAIVFVPLFVLAFFSEKPGLVWHWLDPNYILPGGETVAEDALYKSKAVFLNRDFFLCRVLAYFVFWCGLATILRLCSFAQEKDGRLNWTHRAHNFSAAGIPLCAIASTFAAFDFFMSLSYHWFSTMFGVWFFATSMRAGLAATVVICYLLSTRGHLKGFYKQAHRYDLGSMCFAFTVFWAYIVFSQYFLIYNANVPEETFWFNIRELSANWEHNTWWYLGLWGLVGGYFAVPFLYLLFYRNKINQGRFLFIAIWIMVFHVVDLYYNILPAQTAADNLVGYVVNEFSVTLTDLAAIIGVGALCVWAFLRSLPKAAPIPLRDPRIELSIHHHE